MIVVLLRGNFIAMVVIWNSVLDVKGNIWDVVVN
jgi:hypothetical protein